MTEETPPTLEEVESVAWEDVLEQANREEVGAYSTAFFEAAEDADDRGAEVETRVLRFFGHVTSMIFTLEDPNDPFTAQMVTDTYRTAVVDDFSEEELDLMEALPPEIENYDLRARLGDILWVRRRNHEAARLALESYLSSATVLFDQDDWLDTTYRFERAFQIATLLRDSELQEQVVSHVSQLLGGDLGGNCRHRLLSLMQRYGGGDPKDLSRQATTAAEDAQEEGAWKNAKAFWDLERRFQRELGNEREAKVARSKMGEAKIREAERFVSDGGGGYGAAASHLSEAVDHLRQAGASERAEEIQKRLLDYQRRSVDEMAVIEQRYDASEQAQSARDHVSHEDPFQALCGLATVARPANEDQVKARMKDWEQDFTLQAVIPATILTEDGKPTAKRDSLLDADDKEDLRRQEMCRQVHMDLTVHVQAGIEPARHQILQDHRIRLSHFVEFCRRSPAVPPGREVIYARGLYDGLIGDFTSACRHLVPEVEHFLRYVLSTHGVITTSLRSNGIQRDYPLGVLLDMGEVKEHLGGDLIFTLDALLNSKFGPNFRHRLAHGLLDQTQSHSVAGVYTWWLALHLVFYPFLAEQAAATQQDREQPDGGNVDDA